MLRNLLLRALRSPRPHARSHISKFGQRRLLSVKPDDLKPDTSEKTRSRILRLTQRLPKFLQRYTAPLVHAPLTHISAFLILHELTAIVPLFGLAATFHYTQWLPTYFAEGKIFSEGTKRFGNYARKKGWLGDEETRRYRWFGKGEKGTRLVVEFATAYAITKVLMPFRIVFSVYATPWFAKISVVPFMNAIRRALRSRKMKPPTSGSAGTGAVGGGVGPGQK